jgi:Putative beta-barrel porin 2
VGFAMTIRRRGHLLQPRGGAGILSFALVLLAALPLRAQEIKAPDPSRARLRIGPVALNPTVNLTNLGIDTNVFNEPTGLEKEDFTFTLTPRLDAWLKVGPTWVGGSARADVVWYQTYDSERSGNGIYTVNWTAPLNRLAFAVEGSYLHARERPGFEIDDRVLRTELAGRAAVEYRVLSKTWIGVRGGRQRVEFDEDQIYHGTDLSVELNRTVTTAAFTVKHQLTPLTAITFDAGSENDRFVSSPARDTDSTTAGAQITFDPDAILKGSARFGYRDFVPVDPNVPKYTGTTASADLTYVLQGSTKMTFQLNRDVQYSYDVNHPYYLQTGLGGSVFQQIYGPVDVVGRIATTHLDYRERLGGAVETTDRTDHVLSFGGGAGYHIGTDVRVGFNVDKQKRTSDDVFHSYEGLRVGVSLTYGL